MTRFGKYAFVSCDSLSSINISDIAAWCNISFDSYESNPLYYAKHLFLNGEEIKDLIIPNSVTSIESKAFVGCSNLSSVTIPNSVTRIGRYAFVDCDSLFSINISDLAAWCNISFEGYDSNSFYNVNPFNNANHLFLNGEEIKELVIPQSVTNIGHGAFRGLTGLISVTIPNSVTNIGSNAFYGCTGLTSAVIGNSVTSIGSLAFMGCNGLTSVTIPNSVTTIGYAAFQDCRSLTSAIIGNSVTTIEEHAFYNCDALTNVTIPNSVTIIGNSAFYGCIGLTSAIIGNSVTNIGSRAFYGCRGLTSITIPNSVMTIGNGAFSGWDLPVVISKIDYPFTIGAMTFSDDTFFNATLYVPFGTINIYKRIDGWKKFVCIQEGEPSGISNVETERAKEKRRYTLNGRAVKGSHKGINIIQMNNGTTKKVVVK